MRRSCPSFRSWTTRTSRMPDAGSSGRSTRCGSRPPTVARSGTWSPMRSPPATPPETVNPSLWRQAQLLGIHGLFEVAPGFYQVRGFDLSNMHLIEGEKGVIVADPLISHGDGGRGAGSLPQPSRRSPGHRADLQPQPRRPLRRRPRNPQRGGGRGRRRAGDRPGGLPRACDQRERLRRHGDGATGGLHVRRVARAGTDRPAHRRARADHLHRHRDVDPADAATSSRAARRRRSTGSASGSSSRPAPRRLRR